MDEGPPLAELLSGVLEAAQKGHPHAARGVSVRHLEKLLGALERDASNAVLPGGGLTESLSGRELEVLQLVSSGKSNRRVAEDLYVGVGTVKTHLNNAYRKLGAHSRTQAVARARELGLI